MKIKIGTKENGEPFELDVQEHLIDSGLAIIGKRGTGKSYCVGKICEELVEVGQPFIIIDVMGQYYTLKQKYPVAVISLGEEEYADIKEVTPEMAENLARAILESGQSTVIDVSYGTMLEQYKFMAEFFKAFYEHAKQVARPVVLVIDEIHRITPEKSMLKLREVSKYQNEVTYWVAEIARTGRKHGIGYIVAGQREAETAKTSLTQCEIQINFKVTGIDFENLRKRIDSQLAERVKHFDKGEAIVLGFEEEFIVRIDRRKTPHGGKTPDFKPVSLDLSKFTQLLKLPKKEPPREKEADTEIKKEYEREVERLREEVKRVQSEREELLKRVRELEEKISELNKENIKIQIDYRHEVEKLKAELEKHRKMVKEYEEEISKASELEKELENIREAARTAFEALVEFSEVAGVELIPSDVMEWKRRAEEAEEKLRIYEMTEKERRLRAKETLEDRAVKSWIADAKKMLHELKTRTGIFPEVLKQAIRYDPETVFRPEDFDVDVTPETVRRYLRELAGKGILIEVNRGGKTGFRNGIYLWVTQKIRKIKPAAPDEAIEEIANHLVDFILGRD